MDKKMQNQLATLTFFWMFWILILLSFFIALMSNTPTLGGVLLWILLAIFTLPIIVIYITILILINKNIINKSSIWKVCLAIFLFFLACLGCFLFYFFSWSDANSWLEPKNNQLNSEKNWSIIFSDGFSIN